MLDFLRAPSELGVRRPPGHTTGHSDVEEVCSPSFCLRTCHAKIFGPLVTNRFAWNTRKNSTLSASFYLLIELPLLFQHIGRKSPFLSCESDFFSPKLCYANGRKGKWGALLFTSRVTESLSFLHLSFQAPLWLSLCSIPLFGHSRCSRQGSLQPSTLQTVPPHVTRASPTGFFVWAGSPPGVAAVQTNPTHFPKTCP